MRRDASRLLVLDRARAGDPVPHRFADLPGLLAPGDLLVLNDAKVEAARLHARRESGGAVEVLLLRPARRDSAIERGVADLCSGELWEALVRPGRRVRPGDRLLIGDDGIFLTVRGAGASGRRLLELPEGLPARQLFHRWGDMPLPPYIARRPAGEHAALDRERYQTVYARSSGAIAAPTAGLHFTEELLGRLSDAGIDTAVLTLRVGPGTFQPVRSDRVEQHRMEAEGYVLPRPCVDAILAARARGARVVGVGTTVVRTLEYAARRHGGIEHAAGEGEADVFIYPGFEFRVVDAMLTNFHLPRSTPLLMVSALAGRERLLSAYRLAVRERFRFYSYGDAMLIL